MPRRRPRPRWRKLFERADEGEKLALLRTAKQIGAADLVALAVADGSPLVRVAAVDAALGSGMRAAATLSARARRCRSAGSQGRARADRRAEGQARARRCSTARCRSRSRDPDPELSQLALTTIARVAPKEAVVARLNGRSPRAPSASARRRPRRRSVSSIATRRSPSQLLEPLLDDPSHDVRVAMLPALAAAYAKTNTPEKLADPDGRLARRTRCAGSSRRPRSSRSRGPMPVARPARSQLKKLAASGPPMARHDREARRGPDRRQGRRHGVPARARSVALLSRRSAGPPRCRRSS